VTIQDDLRRTYDLHHGPSREEMFEAMERAAALIDRWETALVIIVAVGPTEIGQKRVAEIAVEALKEVAP
jgi:hypothetical protein